MKKIYSLLAGCAVIAAVSSCTKLDVPVESQYVKSNFPSTTADYNALTGTMYSNLSSNFAVNYWRLQELSTDEAILPARDGNFDDGGQYRQLHYHTWTADHPTVTAIWQWGFSGINTCNRLLTVIDAANSPASVKTAYTAEIKAMRALYYYFMMDTYGNVPIITSFPVANPPANQPRAKVFDFIESELKAVLPLLPAKSNSLATNTMQYGRPTKGMVFALLAKMYLNAPVYNGTNRNQDVVTMADSVQRNTNYSLDARFRDIFLPNNGPQINETIFAIPYDQQIPGNQFTRFGFFFYLAQAYGFNVNLSIAMSTTPEFYNRFNIPNDFRTKTWLAGPQYYPDGNGGFTSQPVYYPNTTTQININPVLTLVPGKPMDLGNTIASQSEGVRSIKYYPDPQIIQSTRLNGNDVPVFRLGDVYLMKAEAILRGATPTVINGDAQTPLTLVNKLRARAGAQTAQSIDLNSLLDERARELSWEAWRRNDLIRYGIFEKEYPLPNDNLKMNTDPTRRLYPIPSTELKTNPNLVQNQGY
ncbi:RagB/SusD family nutrient uptake outer membrane protein [Mucilaginibacter achroorhodeus]|uniref:RagB/SusD family nutrient uptake outer membrane protein n=1 Tax=Mucilaginibacter achroorhodeus TaxID=2599294 RepID=A0A563U0N5_9SPHI|nr:RagB/SusD family nutrient uptake outer membrane protein [Mucilaginibacter achroorhodeus]TWR24940.1 RagB/SusD family nutrient uptake outer membrane protein [Mucilaginibacter achroorhodeus]